MGSYKLQDLICYLCLPLIALYYLLETPFANVEERFILNTAYDFSHGVPYEEFHHIKHPHVVPRTILPSLILTLIAKPLIWLNVRPIIIQIVLRAIVAIPGIFGYYFIAREMRSRYGVNYMRAFLVLTALQSKTTYYISRTYPNIVAQNLLIYMWGFILRNDYLSAVKIVCYVAVILRSEVALLLIPLCIGFLFYSKFDVWRLLKAGAIHSFTALFLTAIPDSFFWKNWGRFVWAELTAFIFNVIDGTSIKWGASEFSFYFERIPSMLRIHWIIIVSLMAIAILSRKISIYPFICGAFYVFTYSLLPHKEERFVTYINPLWNILMILGASVFMSIKVKPLNFLLKALIPVIIVYLFLSSEKEFQFRVGDYVGGIAAQSLYNYVPRQNISVLLSEHCVQHGATLFTLPKDNPKMKFELIEDNPSHFIEEHSWVKFLFGDNCKDCPVDLESQNPDNYDIYLCSPREKPNETNWDFVEAFLPVEAKSINPFAKLIPDAKRRDVVSPVHVYVKKSSWSKIEHKK